MNANGHRIAEDIDLAAAVVRNVERCHKVVALLNANAIEIWSKSGCGGIRKTRRAGLPNYVTLD
jgi:hypothetical protein